MKANYTHIKGVNFTKLGATIRAHRYRNGKNTLQLAKEVGLGASTIQNIENQNQNPSWDSLLKICKGLNLNAEKLLLDCKLESFTESNNEEIKDKIKQEQYRIEFEPVENAKPTEAEMLLKDTSAINYLKKRGYRVYKEKLELIEL